MDIDAIIILSEAIGYLEAEARKIDKRRNRWWKRKSYAPNYAREIALNLKRLRRKKG